MDLDQLLTFAAAAELLSFTKAARRRHLSQPAVSGHIRQLEERLAVVLFDRRGKHVSLTPAGERLRVLAGPILHGVAALGEALDEFRAGAQGLLRIAGGTSVGIYLLPHAVSAFVREHPRVKVAMMVGRNDEIEPRLREHALHFALVGEPVAPRVGWISEPLLEDELVLISAPGRLQGARLSLDALRREPFILRDASSQTRARINSALIAAGLDPGELRIRCELDNTEGIKQMVMSGLGVGFTSRYAILRELRRGDVVELQLPEIRVRRTVFLVRPTEKALLPHQTLFLELVRQRGWLPPMLVSAPLRRPRGQRRSGKPTA